MTTPATLSSQGSKQQELFSTLGLEGHPWIRPASEATDADVVSVNPTTGEPIAAIRQATLDDYEAAMKRASERFET
jgi:acyl-CoA reductase-like NAD-dependent aldehyde dehydrogenase